jgi:hypothetical protein
LQSQTVVSGPTEGAGVAGSADATGEPAGAEDVAGAEAVELDEPQAAAVRMAARDRIGRSLRIAEWSPACGYVSNRLPGRPVQRPAHIGSGLPAERGVNSLNELVLRF